LKTKNASRTNAHTAIAHTRKISNELNDQNTREEKTVRTDAHARTETHTHTHTHAGNQQNEEVSAMHVKASDALQNAAQELGLDIRELNAHTQTHTNIHTHAPNTHKHTHTHTPANMESHKTGAVFGNPRDEVGVNAINKDADTHMSTQTHTYTHTNTQKYAHADSTDAMRSSDMKFEDIQLQLQQALSSLR